MIDLELHIGGYNFLIFLFLIISPLHNNKNINNYNSNNTLCQAPSKHCTHLTFFNSHNSPRK